MRSASVAGVTVDVPDERGKRMLSCGKSRSVSRSGMVEIVDREKLSQRRKLRTSHQKY